MKIFLDSANVDDLREGVAHLYQGRDGSRRENVM